MYSVECPCGQSVPVEIWQSGSHVTCPGCRSSVKVPDSVTLQEQSGDKYPMLSPLQKVIETSRRGETPFDGRCHGCGTVGCEWFAPVSLKILTQRALDHDGQILPTLTGIKLVAAGGEEDWLNVGFPLFLCSQCRPQFAGSRRKARFRQMVKYGFLSGFAIGCLWLAYVYIDVVAVFASLISFVGAIAWMLRFRQRVNVDPNLMRWLNKIRWLPEVLQSEDEYRVSVGRAQRIDPGSTSHPFGQTATSRH